MICLCDEMFPIGLGFWTFFLKLAVLFVVESFGEGLSGGSGSLMEVFEICSLKLFPALSQLPDPLRCEQEASCSYCHHCKPPHLTKEVHHLNYETERVSPSTKCFLLNTIKGCWLTQPLKTCTYVVSYKTLTPYHALTKVCFVLCCHLAADLGIGHRNIFQVNT